MDMGVTDTSQQIFKIHDLAPTLKYLYSEQFVNNVKNCFKWQFISACKTILQSALFWQILPQQSNYQIMASILENVCIEKVWDESNVVYYGISLNY